ncbi:unnamed protein product [Penicillium pancosmium]
MVVAYAETGYNEDYLDSDFISGIRVDKATQCSLELCLLEYEVSVENGTPNVTTSVLDYGHLFRKNSSFVPNGGETICRKPTPGLPDITIDDPTKTLPLVQLSPTEFAFCGIANVMTLHEDVFVGSMIQGYSRSSDGTQGPTNPYGDPNTIRISSVGLDTIMSNVARYFNNEALRSDGLDVHGTAHVIEVFVETPLGHFSLNCVHLSGSTEHHAIFTAEFALPGATAEAPRIVDRRGCKIEGYWKAAVSDTNSGLFRRRSHGTIEGVLLCWMAK